jgi:hypothetical protein
MIAYNTDPINPPRKIFSVGDAQSQFQPFSNVYRELWDFIEDGNLEALGVDASTIALWRKNVREGVINYGGKAPEIDFFRMMMGGTPKEMDATSISVMYNSALDYNIYAENDATSTTGTVANAYFGSLINGNYTGVYAVFTIATDTYADNGTKSNINVGDSIYNYLDGQNLVVIKKVTAVDYAHQIYVAPYDGNSTINIVAKMPMQPSHIQLTSGYSDANTSQPHSEWETLGYIKEYSPFALRTDWESPRELQKPYRDVLQFPIIFDMVTGQEISSWDFKSMADARERMIMGENVAFFTGQQITNTALTTNTYTNKYFGFEGLMTSIWYGGGNIQEYDNLVGYDLDVDFMQIVFQNDALKLSSEFLFIAGIKWNWAMQRRSQDMFKNNSGACTFQTFERMGDEKADLVRMGVDSFRWRNHTMHVKEASAWSDKRWIGNAYFPATAVVLPGEGNTDSKGNKVSPVEYYIPKNERLSSQWEETWRDEMTLSSKADKFSGTITHTICMTVNCVENMWAVMPKYVA